MGRGSWKWIGSHLGTILGVGTLTCGLAASWAVAQYQLNEQRGDIDQLVTKQEEDRGALIEIRTDVKWIRAAIDRKAGNE